MVTTRDLEQSVEDALLEAGASEQRARTAASKLGDEIVQLATKDDLKEEIHALRRELLDRMSLMERTNWRITLLVLAMWSATFGALMYAVFG